MARIALETTWIAVCKNRCTEKDGVVDFDASKEMGNYYCPRCSGYVTYIKVGMWMLNEEPLIDRRGFHRLWIR